MKIRVVDVQRGKPKTIGMLVPCRGHKVWAINVSTLDVKEAEIQTDVDLKGNQDSKIKADKNCLYITALNQKNALKVIGAKPK